MTKQAFIKEFARVFKIYSTKAFAYLSLFGGVMLSLAGVIYFVLAPFESYPDARPTMLEAGLFCLVMGVLSILSALRLLHWMKPERHK